MSKKIAFVAASYIPQYDGISVYTENLLQQLLQSTFFQNGDNKLDIYIGKNSLEVLKQRILDTGLALHEHINLIEINDKNFFFKLLSLIVELYRNKKYDLIYVPNMMPLLFGPGKIVTTVHDLSPEITSELYPVWFRYYHAFLVQNSGKWLDGVGYISDSTKADMYKFYKIYESNATMLYLPNGIPFKVQQFPRPDMDQIVERYTSKELSFLVVGRVNKAKGFDRIVEFLTYFDLYVQKEDISFFNITVHIVGKQTEETKELLNDANFTQVNIIYHGYLNDEKLNKLYITSQFCFFLSRNEGYGLPLVEALWFRAIPILSDIPIFNEILGDVVPKFNDQSGYTHAIADFIEKCYQSPLYLKDLLQGLESVVEKEKLGYKRASENLIKYIESL